MTHRISRHLTADPLPLTPLPLYRFPVRAASILREVSHDLLLLLALLVIVGGTWGFIELADEVSEGSTRRLDDYVLRGMRRADDPSRPIGPSWLPEIGRDLTALGGVAVLTLVTLGVTGYLLIRRQRWAAMLVIIATVGGLCLSSILKRAFSRPRPAIVPHLSDAFTSSFPSGHSMLSATVYLTLGALLARFVEQRRLKLYFLVIALLLTFLVGLSRVYMGVHYPTDVLAGWTAGLVWATLCWLVARYLQRTGQIEGPQEATDRSEKASCS